MFGRSKPPQNERPCFIQEVPIAAAKLYAHWVTVNYERLMGYLLVMVFYLTMKVL